MRRVAAALLLVLAAGGSAARAAAGPRAPLLELDGGTLAVGALPDVLGRPEVRAQLGSGLTTSFVVQVAAVDGGGGRIRGGARVDVRYELWDEVYLATARGIDGSVRRESLRSFEHLTAWWKGLHLPVATAAGLGRDAPWQVEVRLFVIPFSEAEQREAQRWFSQSVQRSGAEELSAAADEPSSGLANVLDLLVATSIQRRALLRYDWTVPFRPAAGPERRH